MASRGALVAAGALAVALVSAGCGTGCPTHPAAAPTTTSDAPSTSRAGPSTSLTAPAATTVAATTTTTTTVAATTSTTAPVPTFSDNVSPPLTASALPYSWHSGCPVPPDQLRQIQLTYWGFDGAAHPGRIVVNASVVPGVVKVFSTLFAERFPIRGMVPVDAYHGSDDAAAAADDTSGFNCRNAVTSGPPQWSVHAYGEAIDVNDVENPYVFGSTVIPPAGASYANRGDVRPGMAVPGGQLVDAFAAVGWQWGGRWTGSPDYQHFSLTGG